MGYVDFAELKSRLLMTQAIRLLNLDLKHANGQWRGPCPVCQLGGKRALVITEAKSAFYCFGCKLGGDVIALAALIRDCSVKEAAQFLAGKSGVTADTQPTKPDTVPEESRKGLEGRRPLQPLSYLEPGHPKLQALGLSEETCREFGAGYAPKGILRGRLAIPIHDLDGNLVAYCGRAVNGEEPTLIFPKDFEPEAYLFNAHRVGEGELILVRDPLEVLLLMDAGLANAASTLTPEVDAAQLRSIIGLMEQHGCTTIEFH